MDKLLLIIKLELICCCFIFNFSFIYSQNSVVVKDVIGNAFIYDDISPNEAKKIALNEAKLNALKSAGITEHISSYELMYSSQQNKDFKQFFTSDIQSELQGAIQKYDIVKERIYFKDSLHLIYEVKINAEVIKYNSKPDPSFDFVISDIKGMYNNNDNLNFTFKSSMPGYLTIFNIADKSASLLYPYKNLNNIDFEASKLYTFPLNGSYYTLTTEIKPSESNRLIFVFTKKQIPFIKIDENSFTTEESIFSWIYSISPDQRKVQYYSFIIQN